MIDPKNYIILHVPKLEDKKELNKVLHSRGWGWKNDSHDSLKDRPLYEERFYDPKASKEYYALCLEEKGLANVIIYDEKELKKFPIIEIKSKDDKKGWFF